MDFIAGYFADYWWTVVICIALIGFSVWALITFRNLCKYNVARPYIIEHAIKHLNTDDADVLSKQYHLLEKFMDLNESMILRLLRNRHVLDRMNCIKLGDIQTAADIVYAFRNHFDPNFDVSQFAFADFD